MIPQKDWEAINGNKSVSLPTLLRLLVVIVDYLQQHPFFLFLHLVRIPYCMVDGDHFSINYDFTDNSFGIYIQHDLKFSNYDSIRLKFEFSLVIDQLINFETNPELDMIA